MNADFERDELRALMAARNDGTISEDEHARLEKILAGSAEARRLWFLHCDIETGITEWAAARNAGDALTLPRKVVRARVFWKWAVPLAAAALVMLAAVWWWRGPAESRANGAAVLARAVGVEWEDGVERSAGTELAPGELRLKSGAVLVEFYSGARVIIEGPAEFRVVSSSRGFLSRGKINAHVPPQARGFSVDAPGVKVVDFGTDFGLALREGSAAEVHVFRGEVEVTAAALPARKVTGGEAVRVDARALAAISAARADFLSEEELTKRDEDGARDRFAAWRDASRSLDANPATVIHYSLDDTPPAERSVLNHAAAGTEESHGSIVGCAWTAGRWPGKRALQFRSQGDRIRFSAPQPMKAVTLLAWVRVDALPRGQNVLLSADSEQTGALHWLLTNRGELRLEIGRDLGRSHADWEAVNSAPFVTPDRFGQWLLLATTFDGKTIRHYANGKMIGSGASFTPPSLIIGTAEIGNWRGATQRHLASAMDEFAMLARVMSEDDVRAAYAAGKP